MFTHNSQFTDVAIDESLFAIHDGNFSVIREGNVDENQQKFWTFESPDRLTKVGRHMWISVEINVCPGQTPMKVESPREPPSM